MKRFIIHFDDQCYLLDCKKMNIRTAAIEDLKAMVEIYNQAIAAGRMTADITPFTTAGRKKWFLDHTPDKYPIWVGEDNHVIVGYLTISPYRPGRLALRHTAEVSCFIHFEHHRQGIASDLLRHAIGACPALQIKNLFAIIIDSNQASINLMVKYGFEKWGYLPRVAEFDGIEYGHLYYGLRIEKCRQN
ncbi:MAG: N-acetyltransferase family protein [Deltaproteobacteria bacterium]|nr:N-acetyltransferase family protein [Deltaproteobacteria bacterium]